MIKSQLAFKPVLMLLWALFAQPAHATLALDLNSGGVPTTCGSGPCAFSTTFGWGFTLSQTIVVDGLGVWDEGSDGIGVSSQTGLWTSAGNLLADVSVSDSSTPTLSASSNGRWLFENIAPLTLTPGSYLVGSLFYAAFPPAQINAPFLTIPELTGITGRAGSSNAGFMAPLASFSTPIFGPTLRLASAPEPDSLALFAIGAVGLYFRRRYADPRASS